MPGSRVLRIAAIIGTALVLAACSATRLAYNNAPQLASWWLDGYLDFGSEQSPKVKEALERLLGWHRQTQLADYAKFLEQVRTQVAGPITPAQVCGWYALARDKLQPSFERAYEAAADVAPSLQAAQVAYLEQRYAKSNAEFKKDFLQADLAVRRKASVQRAVERAETYYGKLDAAQRQVLEAAVASSPFDAQLWLAERERRQRDTLALLRRWVGDRPDRAQMLSSLKSLAAQLEQSPDPAYRRYQQQLMDYNCRVGAELHNATTPKQREALRKQLAEWEEDLRALAAQVP